MDADAVLYTRPGFRVALVSAQITGSGVITARFKLTDADGLPLDRDGVLSAGPVTTNFLIGYIPQGESQYVSYITRIRTDATSGRTATQATGENTGAYQKVADGEYIYTFAATAPSSIDRTATHTVGLYATRNLSAFGLSNAFSDAVLSFVPDGSAVKTVREVVKTEACNQCHNPMFGHGGARNIVQICILCHTPQTTDPVSNATVDFKVMIHKIHSGASLPSVAAGGSYFVSNTDFSKVVFPANVRNCTVCHQQNTGAAQAANFATNPSRAACGSCHDDVNFATGVNHPLVQVNDNQCSTCHIPQGELEFDASILGAHTVPTQSATLPGTVFDLLKVDNGTAGMSPTVTFSVKDRSGNPILPSAMTRLNLVLAGPTTDYATYVSESALAAKAGSSGTYTYTFATVLPAKASGSYTIGIEGYRNIKLINGVVARDAGKNKQITFSVDGTKLAARRTVVSIDKCNSCHFQLSAHGGNRNQTTECVLCHNPNTTDANKPAQGVNFATLIHKIHRGSSLVNGFTVSSTSFNNVVFPGDLRDCSQCHVNGSEQLPLTGDRLPTNDPKAYIPVMGARTAACLACHDAKSTAAHALTNTTPLGEGCDVCHGNGADFAVSKVHAR